MNYPEARCEESSGFEIPKIAKKKGGEDHEQVTKVTNIPDCDTRRSILDTDSFLAISDQLSAN